MLLFSTLSSPTFFANARLRDDVNHHHGATYNDDDVHDERASSSRILEENFVGLYLIKIMDGERSHDSNADTPANARTGSAGENHHHHHHPTRQTSSIELPDGTIYEVRNAQAGWDTNLTSGRDEIVIPAGSVISSNDGDINVMGQKLSKVVYRSNERTKKKSGGFFFHRRHLLHDDEEDNDVDLYLEHQHSSSSSNNSRRTLQTGTRSVLAVRVLLNDVSYNIASQTGLSNDVFGNGLDTVNLKSQYAACSYNQLLFTKSPNRNMTSNPNDGCTDIRNGVVDIKVNRNLYDIPKEKRSTRIRNAVTRKLNLIFGVRSPNKLANHVMYCYPSGVMSGIAYAYIGSWNSNYNGAWCNYVSTQMHEVCVYCTCPRERLLFAFLAAACKVVSSSSVHFIFIHLSFLSCLLILYLPFFIYHSLSFGHTQQ
jgi:hypothetical protein